jgi:Tat protein translocase TatB subunit
VFNIGPQELLLILLVALVVVGPKRLPELSRTIGRGLREFRKAQDEVKKTINLSLDDSEPTTPGGPRAGRTAGAAAGTAARSGDAAAATSPDPEPSAADTETPADTAADVARTLGRGLAEIRQARREIQRSFRVDLTDEPPRRSSAAKTPATAPPPATDPPATEPPAAEAPAAAPEPEDAPAGPETPA